jgi:hypothetical protein
MKNETTKDSNDIAAFRNLLEIDFSIRTARWEVFGTPEYTGGVPGPTDFITLIAEVEPSDTKTFEARPKTGDVWIAPEAARPWLTEGFRSMLAKNRSTTTDLSSMFNCRKFQGKLKNNAKLAEGFICNDQEKSLIYLTLSDYATS